MRLILLGTPEHCMVIVESSFALLRTGSVVVDLAERTRLRLGEAPPPYDVLVVVGRVWQHTLAAPC
jgi:hypothetical protein